MKPFLEAAKKLRADTRKQEKLAKAKKDENDKQEEIKKRLKERAEQERKVYNHRDRVTKYPPPTKASKVNKTDQNWKEEKAKKEMEAFFADD